MNFATSSGIGAAARAGPGHLVEAEQQLEEPEDRRVRLRRTVLDLGGHRAAELCASTHASAGRHRVLRPALRCRGPGPPRAWPERPVLIFSQTRGTPKNCVGCTSPSAPSSWAGSPMSVHVAAAGSAGCRGRGPARRCGRAGGRRRSVGPRAPARRSAACSRLVEHVVVGEHHALRVAGGAGGVEDRRRVVGVSSAARASTRRRVRRYAAPRGEEVVPGDEAGVVERAASSMHDDLARCSSDSVERLVPSGSRWSAVSRNTDGGSRLPGDEGDLLGRERVVDRHRRRRRRASRPCRRAGARSGWWP